MQYESMMFCEHANECPTSICQCPENCGCREHMCSKSRIEKRFSVCAERDTVGAGELQINGRVLASFGRCHYWDGPGGLLAWGADRLELSEDTVRDIVAGKLPILLLHDVQVVMRGPVARLMSLSISMVWGDFMMYETGEPVVRNFVGVTDRFSGLPPPAVVRRVLSLMKVPKNPL